MTALAAGGFHVQHVAANDGSVWLTDNDLGYFGRFDAPVNQLAGGFNPPGQPQAAYKIDVLQNGNTVLANDLGGGELYAVDVRNGLAGQPGAAEQNARSLVSMGGRVAAMLDAKGHLFVAIVGGGEQASLADLGQARTPVATLPNAAALVVDQQGDVFAASAHRLVTVPFTGGALGPPVTSTLSFGLSGSLSMTVVGSVPVIFDAVDRTVAVPSLGHSWKLPSSVGVGGSDVTMQLAGPNASAVVMADDTGMYSVPLDGSAPITLAGGARGSPASPAVFQGCVHGAWAGTPGYYARACSGAATFAGALPGSTSSSTATVSSPAFRINNGHILLNDQKDGAAWSLNGSPLLVVTPAQWQQLIDTIHPTAAPNLNPKPGPVNKPPKIVDQHVNARPGRSSLLHILDGDSDPEGGLLAIAGLSPASGQGYTAQVTPDLQTASVTLDPGLTAPVHFEYSIIDGRGQTATAGVTVTPVMPDANHPPALRAGFAPVGRFIAATATASYQVLGDWRDPENDPVTVTSANVTGGGQVTWTADGLLTVTAPAVTSNADATVTYSVSDGLAQPVNGTVTLHVLSSGDTSEHAAVALPDAAQVIVGEPAVVRPLDNDIAGADPLDPGARAALAGPVTAPAGLDVSTDATRGTVTVNAAQPGLYTLTYSDAFGSAPLGSSQILIDARAASGGSQAPVTTPQATVLRGAQASMVDVLAGDYDPSGGLLTVIGAHAPPGILATPVDGRWLRVVATTADPGAQLLVTYDVTNGVSQPVAGQLTLSWLPSLPPSPPVVPTIYATVRAGDETDLAVLENATDLAGEPMTLLGSGVTVSGPTATAGTAAASGSTLRYAAPAAAHVTTAERVTISFNVTDSSANTTTGTAVVDIVPADSSHNVAPVPLEVDARVTAGDSVTIPIPTTGVDPAGDSVAVAGIASAPGLGRILSTRANSITYQAYPLSAGTDEFQYRVENAAGLLGEAAVRVAVVPPEAPPAPIAVDLAVVAAPGQTVSIPVLSSDLIAPNDAVSIEDLRHTNSSSTLPGNARLDGGAVDVRAPAAGLTSTLTYGISDGASTPSLAHVSVLGQSGYLTPPSVVDHFPAPPAGKDSIDVDALAGDVGTAGPLRVGTVFVAAVTRGAGGHLEVPVRNAPYAVAYEVSDGHATSVAVIHVPGAAAGPQVKPGALITVPKGGSTTVQINNDIVDSRGPVQLISTDGVSVSPASGVTWQPVSYTSLTVNGVGTYVGPGALVVTVTDGTSPSDPQGRTATLTIPVQVGPPTPVLRCPTTPVQLIEGGPSVVINITSVCAVWTPTPGGAEGLGYTAAWVSRVQGVSISWRDSRDLVLTPASNAAPGAAGSLSVGVADHSATATLPVAVIAASLPTVSAVNLPGVPAGHTQTVDFRQYVTSPLASPQVVVVSVRQTGGGAASSTTSGSTVSITPQPGTTGTVSFVVGVGDIPDRPDRQVQGLITLQVLDVPGAVGALSGKPSDGAVTLSWTAAATHGSPIDYYQVAVAGGGTRQVAGTQLVWSNLNNGTPYQFTVSAHNALGLGPSSSQTSTPQSTPGATGGLSGTGGDGNVQLGWSAAAANGQAIDEYTISVTPAPASGASVQQVSGGATSYQWTGLSNNNGPYSFSIRAHNSVGFGPATQSAAVYAHGAPPAPAAPHAAASAPPSQSPTTSITVSWPAVGQCNDAQPCASYTVTELRNGVTDGSTAAVAACSPCSATFDRSNDGAGFTYELADTNREGQASAASGASAPTVYAQGEPGQPTNVQVSAHDSSLQVQFTVPAANGPAISQVNYQAKDQSGGGNASGTWTGSFSSGSQSPTETISGLANGHAYVVTLQACNQEPNGQPNCGPWSNSSASVTPYGPPQAPAVSASANVQQVTFSWSGGGNNGQPVNHYVVCINGGCSNQSSAGSVTNSYNCNQTVSITAYVVDNANQQSGTSSASATTGCAISVTISWSSNYPRWAVFTLYHFQAGTYTYYCYFSNQSTLGPYNEGSSGASTQTVDNGHTCAEYASGVQVHVHYSAGPGIPPSGLDSNTITSP